MTGQTFDPGPPVDYAWAGEVLQRWVGARTTGDVSALMELLAPFGVVELMRTGRIAMSRGKRAT